MTCTLCRRDLGPDHFYVRATGRIERACKTCSKAASNGWYRRNKERASQQTKMYRFANADELREKRRRHYLANKDQVNARNKAYYAANRERIIAADKLRRDTPEARAAAVLRAKLWAEANPERAAAGSKKWRDAHKPVVMQWAKERRARLKGATVRDLTAAQWAAIKERFGNKCAYCRRGVVQLTQDHITPLSKGGGHTASNIVPACASCNSTKHTGPPLTPVQPLLLV